MEKTSRVNDWGRIMRHFEWKVVTVIGSAVAAIVVTILGVADDFAPKESVPSIIVRHEDLNLGTVWARNEFDHVIHLSNQGVEKIELVRLSASCSCTQVAPESFQVAAGVEVPISLKLNLTSAKLAKEPRLPFAIEITADFMTAKGKSGRASWMLKGIIERGLVAETESLLWEISRPREQEQVITKEIRLECDFPLIDLLVVDHDPEIIATVEMKSSTAVILLLRAVGNGVFDLSEVAVWLQPVSSELDMPPQRLAFPCRIADDFVCSPSEITFGVCPVGSIQSRDVMVQSRRSEELPELEIQCDWETTEVLERVEYRTPATRVYEIRVRVEAENSQSLSVGFSESGRKPSELNIRYIGSKL